MNNQLQHLLRKNPHIWLGDEAHPEGVTGSPTGYPSLDAILPGGGWPKNALVEVITPHWNTTEMQLLLPHMKKVTEQQQWVLLVLPPFMSDMSVLINAGIDMNYVMIIDADTPYLDAVENIEKSLQSQNCSLVLMWLNHLPNPIMRRFQLAAHSGKTSGIIFRHYKTGNFPSALQIQLKHFQHGVHAHIIKARGPHRHNSVNINLPLH